MHRGAPLSLLDASGHHAGDSLLAVAKPLLTGSHAVASLLLHENQLTVSGIEQLANMMSSAEDHPTDALVVTHEDARYALKCELELKRPREMVARRIQAAVAQVQEAVAAGRARRRGERCRSG